MNWNWMFRYVLLGPLLRAFFKVHVVGRENLPAKGPFVLAIGSHTTELESALIQVYLCEHEIHFLAKAEYWHEKGFKGKLKAWFMTRTGQIPVKRLDPRNAGEVVDIGAAVLRDQGVLALYPEATRSKDGKLHKGRTGVVRTAIRGGAVIVPIGLIGFDKLNPPGKGFRPGIATMVIGKPIDPLIVHDVADMAARAAGSTKMLEHTLSRPVTEHLMRTIAKLCHKQYDSEYLEIGKGDVPMV
jgi:1-acyl-sn-glycerol-3-phosphate acyltransferase